MMRYLILIVAIVLAVNHSQAQRTIHAEAIGKTIFFPNNSNMKLAEDYKKQVVTDIPTIVSKAIGRTVFVNPKTYTVFSDSFIPPTLEFENITPNWQDVIENDSRLSNPNFEFNDQHANYFYNAEIIEGKILSFYGFSLNFGSLVTCHDLTTGEELWQNAYTLDNQEYMELFRNAYALGNNTVELIGTRLGVQTEFPLTILSGKAIKRVINLTTGETQEIITSDQGVADGAVIFGNTSADLAPTGKMVGNYMTSMQFGYSGESMYSVGPITFDDKIEGEFPSDENYWFKASSPNNSSVTLSTDIVTKDDQYIFATFSLTDIPSVSDTKNNLIFADADGNALKVVSFENEIGKANNGKIYISDEGITILGRSIGAGCPTSTSCNFNAGIVRFDLDGNIISSEKVLEIDGRIVDQFADMVLLPDGSELYLFNEDGGNQNELFIYKYKDNVYDYISTVTLRDEKLQIYLQESHYDESLGLVMNLGLGVYNQNNEFIREFDYLISIDRMDLGLPSSIDDLENANSSVKIYPNPTKGTFFLSIKEPKASIVNVFNINGQLLTSENIENTEVHSFDLKEFGSGVYIVEIITAQEKIVKKLIVE